MDKKKSTEKKAPPIIDGDARPDMPLDPIEANRKSKKGAGGKNKVTSERFGDVNSLEDFKDSK